MKNKIKYKKKITIERKFINFFESFKNCKYKQFL